MRAKRPYSKYQSGFTNTDIIGNEDLFPTEGYDWIPHDPTQSTRDRNISVDFPFNRNVTSKVKQYPIDAVPPEQVIDKPLPKVTRFRSKLIKETTLDMRKKQRDYNQKLAEYRNEVRANEIRNAEEDLAAFRQTMKEEEARHEGDKAALRKVYEDQIALHRKNEEIEKERERKEAEHYKALYRQQEEEDRKKAQERYQLGLKMKEEFTLRNQQLEKYKRERHQREKEEELTIRKQAETLSKVQEERRIREEEIRLEKTRRREKVVEIQAKALAAEKARNARMDSIGESVAQANAERARTAALEKQRLQQEERHHDWVRLNREKALHKKNLQKKQFPSKYQPVDEDEFKRVQAAKERKMYQTMQKRQMTMRAQREKEELEEDLRLDNEMITATQKKFETSLARLQTLVPPELGLTVPKYTVSTKITGMI